MAIEQIKKIKEAESRADEIRKQGHIDAKKMVEAAKKDAADLITTAHEDGEAMYKTAIADAEQEAQTLYDRMINETEKECEVISAEADKNFNRGISIIMRRVVG